MPKSKANKKVSLTKTKKKGLDTKKLLVDEIRKCVDNYSNIFIFSYENMRNKFLHEVRLHWRTSGRFFFGKNRIMALSLGRTAAEEISENLHLLSQNLTGNKALFFTNASKEDVLQYFDNLKIQDYARAGNVAIDSYEIPEGELTYFSHALEPHLRKLGLPTELKKGVPTLIKSFPVCSKGDLLNPEQAKILKLFGQEMAYFRMRMEYLWSKGGFFEELNVPKIVDSTEKPLKKSKKLKAKKLMEVES